MVASPNDMLEKFEMPYSPTMETDDRLRKKALKPEDPMSHRIIEKRRRDRMNNCLADLSRLIPADYLKKGRGRIEKTEIIEMAIKHMRHLQTVITTNRLNDEEKKSGGARLPVMVEHYRLGFLECLSEAMHFLVEIQGFFAGDALCVQLLNHLHRHCDRLLQGDSLNFPRQGNETNSSSSNSTGSHEGTSPPLGMSSSTGGHSDEHPEFSAFSSENDEPQYVSRKYSQSSGVGSFIKEEHEGGCAVSSAASYTSQLRDMLQNGGRKGACPTIDPLTTDDQHMYKFKNNIQQRYNEEEEASPPCKKIKTEDTSANKLSFGHKIVDKGSDTSSAGPSGVPIFALHANGAFYIPLTLEQHSLTSFMPALTAKPPHKTALHPVTISVNFQQQPLSTERQQ